MPIPTVIIGFPENPDEVILTINKIWNETATNIQSSNPKTE